MITGEERQVGDLLRAVEAPRSNADVARAVVRGRRRRRRRGVAAVAAATVLVVATGLGTVAVRRTLAGPEPAATATCGVTVLPNPPNLNLKVVLDLDPTGRYVVGRYHWARFEDAYTVRWDGVAEPEDLRPDDGEPGPRGPVTVLSDGTVLLGSDDFGPGFGAVWRPGTWTDLYGSYGYNISLPGWLTPKGEVAGWGKKTFLADYGTTVWPTGSERGMNPSTPVPHFMPLAVGSTGVTVGIRWDPDRYVVHHPDGRERDLPLPAGLSPHDAAQVTGDWAVGTAMERGRPEVVGINIRGEAGGPVPVRFNLATGAVDRIAGADGAVAPGVSGNGTVAYADETGRAMLRAPNGRAVRLPMPPGRHVVDRLQMSDDGRTVVGALRVPGTTDVIEAIRWRC